jgi:hypothetical protein
MGYGTRTSHGYNHPRAEEVFLHEPVEGETEDEIASNEDLDDLEIDLE